MTTMLHIIGWIAVSVLLVASAALVGIGVVIGLAVPRRSKRPDAPVVQLRGVVMGNKPRTPRPGPGPYGSGKDAA